MANDYLQNLMQSLDMPASPTAITGTDPFTKQAILQLGAQLMQPIQPGQTAAGHFGEAAMGALDTFNKQRLGARTAQAASDKFQLEQDKAESLANLQKSQAGYYDRMPQATGGSTLIEQRNKNWETARKMATDRLKYLIESGAELDQIKNYDPSVESRIIYYRDFASPEERKTMEGAYQEWLKKQPKGKASTSAPEKAVPVPAKPPASVEAILQDAQNRRMEREKVLQERKKRSEQDTVIYKYRDALAPGGVGVNANEAAEGIRTLTELYPELKPEQQFEAARVIKELSDLIAGQ